MTVLLNCLILGQTSEYIFNVLVDNYFINNDGVKIYFDMLTVVDFKEILSRRREVSGITSMNIWKVELTLEDLKNISTEDDIKEHGKKMEPTYRFNRYFNENNEKPKVERLHIFIEDRVPETILTRAQKIMEDIMKLPEDPNVYSNTKNFLSLPFPFLGKKKPERFAINNDDKFLYMGRKAFDNILNTINGLECGHGYMDFLIYGTIGYGKSYILAAIVCFLLRTGKRVVFLPDCHELARNPEDYIKSALFLTYANDVKMNEIHACKTLDDIMEFCESSELLYFIVDQMNAFDCHNDTEIDKAHKYQIKGALNKMISKHYYIRSLSANNISAWHLENSANERRIKLYGGFDENEMSQWWMKNGSNLPLMIYEQKKKIEYITGQNPLYLSSFLGSKKNFKDIWYDLNQLLIEKIKMPMANFSDNIHESKRWDIHIRFMSSCLTNGYPPSGYGIIDYDHRFFYIRHNRCCCISGYAWECVAVYLFERGKMDVFASSSWIHCVKEFKNDPLVKGFMIEKACLASIFKNGFMANVISFKFENYKFFYSIKEINFSLSGGLCAFYLPHLWNKKSISIDGLITFCKKESRGVKEDILHIVPIQIALCKDTHSDSEATFFSRIWPELKSRLPDALKVEVIFIWITTHVDYFIEVSKKRLRGKNNEINLQYTVVVIALKNINIELEKILLCS